MRVCIDEAQAYLRSPSSQSGENNSSVMESHRMRYYSYDHTMATRNHGPQSLTLSQQSSEFSIQPEDDLMEEVDLQDSQDQDEPIHKAWNAIRSRETTSDTIVVRVLLQSQFVV